MPVTKLWQIALTDRAERDILEIADWTAENFGQLQAAAYSKVIYTAARELELGPDPIGVKLRDDIFPGLRLIHVARHGRHGRHLILFRIVRERERMIEILRILHDQMDLIRHLPTP